MKFFHVCQIAHFLNRLQLHFFHLSSSSYARKLFYSIYYGFFKKNSVVSQSGNVACAILFKTYRDFPFGVRDHALLNP